MILLALIIALLHLFVFLAPRCINFYEYTLSNTLYHSSPLYHSSHVWSVAFSPDGTKIVSGSHDETVRVWDAVTGTLSNTLEGHSSDVTSVAFSPDGTKIVSGSKDKTVRIWDARERISSFIYLFYRYSLFAL